MNRQMTMQLRLHLSPAVICLGLVLLSHEVRVGAPRRISNPILSSC
jgi:hypothetical protein